MNKKLRKVILSIKAFYSRSKISEELNSYMNIYGVKNDLFWFVVKNLIVIDALMKASVIVSILAGIKLLNLGKLDLDAICIIGLIEVVILHLIVYLKRKSEKRVLIRYKEKYIKV